MTYKRIVLIFIFFTCLLSTTHAKCPDYYSGNVFLSLKAGNTRNLIRLGILMPFSQSVDKSHLFFFHAFGLYDSIRSREVNAGIGYRHLLTNSILGFTTFYDERHNNYNNKFSQLTFSLEYLQTALELRVNFYVPIMQKQHIVTTAYNYRANYYHLQRNKLYKEVALGGFDSEIGYYFGSNNNLGLFLGYYSFTHAATKNMQGTRLRADYKINQYFNINFELTYDDIRKTNYLFGLTTSVSIGKDSASKYSNLERKMMQPVVRDIDVITSEEEYSDEEEAPNSQKQSDSPEQYLTEGDPQKQSLTEDDPHSSVHATVTQKGQSSIIELSLLSKPSKKEDSIKSVLSKVPSKEDSIKSVLSKVSSSGNYDSDSDYVFGSEPSDSDREDSVFDVAAYVFGSDSDREDSVVNVAAQTAPSRSKTISYWEFFSLPDRAWKSLLMRRCLYGGSSPRKGWNRRFIPAIEAFLSDVKVNFIQGVNLGFLLLQTVRLINYFVVSSHCGIVDKEITFVGFLQEIFSAKNEVMEGAIRTLLLDQNTKGVFMTAMLTFVFGKGILNGLEEFRSTAGLTPEKFKKFQKIISNYKGGCCRNIRSSVPSFAPIKRAFRNLRRALRWDRRTSHPLKQKVFNQIVAAANDPKFFSIYFMYILQELSLSGHKKDFAHFPEREPQEAEGLLFLYSNFRDHSINQLIRINQESSTRWLKNKLDIVALYKWYLSYKYLWEIGLGGSYKSKESIMIITTKVFWTGVFLWGLHNIYSAFNAASDCPQERGSTILGSGETTGKWSKLCFDEQLDALRRFPGSGVATEMIKNMDIYRFDDCNPPMDLSGIGLTGKEIVDILEALDQSTGKGIVDLRYNRIDNAHDLINIMRTLNKQRQIDLRGNNLGANPVAGLLPALSKLQLRELIASEQLALDATDDQRQEFTRAIGHILENSHSLEYLDLSGNRLGDKDIQVIANAVNPNFIKRLNLANNAITINGLSAISAKKYPALEELYLQKNQLGIPSEILPQNIADGFIDSPINTLDISDNNFGSNGGHSIMNLAELLQGLPRLEQLIFNRNKCYSDAPVNSFRRLGEILALTPLHYLSMQEIPSKWLNDGLITSVMEGIANNPHVKKVDFSFTNLQGNPVVDTIFEMLSRSMSIQYVQCSDCGIDKTKGLFQLLQQNDNITSFIFPGNRFGADMVNTKKMFSVLSSRLKELNVANDPNIDAYPSPGGLVSDALANQLPNMRALRIINVSNFGAGFYGGDAFIRAIVNAFNKNLTYFGVRQNLFASIPDVLRQFIDKARFVDTIIEFTSLYPVPLSDVKRLNSLPGLKEPLPIYLSDPNSLEEFLSGQINTTSIDLSNKLCDPFVVATLCPSIELVGRLFQILVARDNLLSLDLSYNNFGVSNYIGEMGIVINEIKELTKLRELNFSGNKITDDNVLQSFLESLFSMPNLTSIDLSDMLNIPASKISLLNSLQQLLSKMHKINLSGNLLPLSVYPNIMSEQLVELRLPEKYPYSNNSTNLATALLATKAMKKLDISNIEIQPEDVLVWKYFFGNNVFLEDLSLGAKSCYDPIISAIANLTNIKILRLLKCQLSDSSIELFGNMVANMQSLHTLELIINSKSIDTLGPAILSKLSVSIKNLILANNPIGTYSTAMTIAIGNNLPRLSNLKLLDLSNTQIGNLAKDGLLELAKGIKYSNVTDINLQDVTTLTKQGDEGAAALYVAGQARGGNVNGVQLSDLPKINIPWTLAQSTAAKIYGATINDACKQELCYQSSSSSPTSISYNIGSTATPSGAITTSGATTLLLSVAAHSPIASASTFMYSICLLKIVYLFTQDTVINQWTVMWSILIILMQLYNIYP